LGGPPKTESTAAGIQNILTNLPEAPAAGYEIVQSALHATRQGKEAHTFLLDKKTGSIWQMKCTKTSDDVEFHRVHRFGFDGKARIRSLSSCRRNLSVRNDNEQVVSGRAKRVMPFQRLAKPSVGCRNDDIRTLVSRVAASFHRIEQRRKIQF